MPDKHVEVPIRDCDFGGWTDTWFAVFGYVLNFEMLIRLYGKGGPFRGIEVIVRAVESENEGSVEVRAQDSYYDVPKTSINVLRKRSSVKHDLLLSVLHLIHKKRYYDFKGKDITIWILSPAPPGASLGTSAAVSVAIIKAFCETKITPVQIAHLAFLAETEIMGGQSGIQDQYAAAFGNPVNFIHMRRYPEDGKDPDIVCHPVALTPAFREKLEERLITVFYGKHNSSAEHRRVIDRLEKKGPKAPQLVKLRRFPKLAKRAILSEDLLALGQAMIGNNNVQAQLAEGIVSNVARHLIEDARLFGAIGWMVNGAGGAGGSVTILFDEPENANKFFLHYKKIENPYEFYEHKFAA